MVIVKLMGGLGNQMFQYAAGRSLALRLKTELKLDLTFLEGNQAGNTTRSFALDPLSINASRASGWEIACRAGTGSTFLSRTAARAVQRARGFASYRERHFQVDPGFFTLGDDVHLEGYWQSERYFSDYREQIRRELSPKEPLSGKDLELAKEMRPVEAVALHVRCGDYLASAAARALHQVCDAGYYRAAEELMAQAVKNPHFFVFSDDPEWARENLELSHPATYVSHNGGRPHEDLRLMSLCRHHIIANSSFSWWGAWLSDNAGKTVLAPRRWFNDPTIDTGDVTPAGWQRISW